MCLSTDFMHNLVVFLIFSCFIYNFKLFSLNFFATFTIFFTENCFIVKKKHQNGALLTLSFVKYFCSFFLLLLFYIYTLHLPYVSIISGDCERFVIDILKVCYFTLILNSPNYFMFSIFSTYYTFFIFIVF